MTSMELYVISIIVGLLLLGVEIFLPGGVFGVLGAIFFVGALVIGFFAFGPQGGAVSALLLIVAGVLMMIAWLKFFPRTRMGLRLSLHRDERDFKSSGDDLAPLLGQEGVAQSSLRPSGIATIGGARHDVVAEAGYVEPGQRVRVIQVEGRRVVVRPVAADGGRTA
jgi:membrane-bound ClpP family serine protease